MSVTGPLYPSPCILRGGYSIVTEAELREGAARLAAYSAASGTNGHAANGTGHIFPGIVW